VRSVRDIYKYYKANGTEDPMATEILSEGIRVFVQDLKTLRETMPRRRR